MSGQEAYQPSQMPPIGSWGKHPTIHDIQRSVGPRSNVSMTGATGTSLGPNGHRYAETIQLQELFFGPAKYNTTNDPHALLDRVNNPLPVAWYDKDSNLRVQELLIQSVLATQERLLDWMPVTYHEGGNLFEFREVKFNLSLPDRIPEQGVPRLMTQNYSQWRASITRYGLAFIMEDGFRMTDMGIRDYNAQTQQISNGATCLMCMDALFAMLNRAMPYTDVYLKKGNPYPWKYFQEAMKNETSTFAMIHKHKEAARAIGLYKSRVFKNRRVQPDGIIFPPGSDDLFHKDENAFNFQTQGERGPTMRDSASTTFDKYTSGLAHYTSGLFPIGPEEDCHNDPLVRPMVHLEYIRERWQSGDYTNYTTDAAGVSIQNFEENTIAHVRLANMVKNAPIWDDKGMLNDDGKAFFKTASPHDNVPSNFVSGSKIDTLGAYLDFHKRLHVVATAVSSALAATANGLQSDPPGGDFGSMFVGGGAGGPVQAEQDAWFDDTQMSKRDTLVQQCRAAKDTLADLKANGSDLERDYAELALAFIADGAGVTAARLQAAHDAVESINVGGHTALLSYLRGFRSLCAMQYGAKSTQVATVQKKIDALLTASGAKHVQLTVSDVIGVLNNLKIDEISRDHFEWFLRHDVPLPINFVLLRFIATQMGSFIIGKRGGDMGRSFLGQVNFQLSHIGIQKMLFCYATFYTGAVVIRPDYIHVMENVRCLNYMSGGGVEFWDPINDVEDYARGEYPKHIYCMPVHHTTKLDAFFDITGSLPHDIVQNGKDRYKNIPGLDILRGIWAWAQPDDSYADRNYFDCLRGMPTVAHCGPAYYAAINSEGQVDRMAYFQKGSGHIPLAYQGAVTDLTGDGDKLTMELPGVYRAIPAC